MPTPYLEQLNYGSEAHEAKGNTVVAFGFHMDHLFTFGKTKTRETNAVGDLIRTYKGAPPSEPGGELE